MPFRIVPCLVNVSAAEETIQLDRTHDNVVAVFIKQYTLRGVPLVAGEPYSRFFILSCSDSSARSATGNVPFINSGPYILVDGAVTRRDLEEPIRLCSGVKDFFREFGVRLRDETGNDAQFTDLLLDMALVVDDCPQGRSKVWGEKLLEYPRTELLNTRQFAAPQ